MGAVRANGTLDADYGNHIHTLSHCYGIMELVGSLFFAAVTASILQDVALLIIDVPPYLLAACLYGGHAEPSGDVHKITRKRVTPLKLVCVFLKL